MNPPLKTARSAPLFLQMLALLLVGLMAAQLLTAAIIVLLPPPAPEIYRLQDVAAALRGGSSDRLSLASAAEPPATRYWLPRDARGEVFDRMAGRDLARLLQIEPAKVRVVDVRPVPLFDPVIRFRFGRGPGDGPRGGMSQPGEPGSSGAGLVPQGAGSWRAGEFHGGRDLVLFGNFKAAVQRSDGGWAVVQPRRNAPYLWQQKVLIWLFGCAVLFAPLAYLFARRLTRPITAFAAAAERLGRNPRAPAMVLDGPAEVRVAVEAFNGMQQRLSRYVDDRTAMIGAVAHDLRTPLTRMRFLLEARPDDVQGKMEREIDEMDAMISATLAFVKDASTAGDRVLVDVGSLVETQAADLAETGAAVSCETAQRLIVRGDPLALRRLFGNLLANALKFAGSAEVSAHVEGQDAVVVIADRGPGLPEADLDHAFEPFFRSERSRNRETGGIGLGLAVVRSVARAHGGDAVLSNREGGGLCCTVTLPLEAVATS